MATDSPVVVIGIGNEYRGDDGVGLYVSRKVEQQGLRGVRVIPGIGDGIQMIEAWDGVQTAYVIDCVAPGVHPGLTYRFDGLSQQIPEKTFRNCTTHCFSVVTSIELATALGRLPSQLYVYGVEGRDFTAGAGLSSEVISGADEVAERIVREIAGGDHVSG